MCLKNFRLIIALIICQLCLSQSIEEIDIEKTLSKTSKPNILLILADDLGFGDIEGLFSHPTSITPNINALASQSRVFTNFYVASPVCSPSRAALLTGKYPQSTGIYPGVFWPDSVGGLSAAKYPTISSKLRDAGYATSHIGKWHLGVGRNGEYLPTKHGFESYLGIPYSHDMCPCKICFPKDEKCAIKCNEKHVSCPLIEANMLDQHVAVQVDYSTNSTLTNKNKNPNKDEYNIIQQPAYLPNLTDIYTKRAIDIMKTNTALQRPFFLYFAYHQTHHPQFAGIHYRNASYRGGFGDALEEMDSSIGKLMDHIKTSGIENNTMIIFTSDNGPSLTRKIHGGCAGLLRCGKGTTWEGGQRVPGFISFPGQIEPGKSHSLITALDIMPTILSTAGLHSNTSLDGVGYDLSDLLFRNVKGSRDTFLYYSDHSTEATGPFAVRYKNYKAHFYTQGSALSDNTNYDEACHGSPHPKKWDPPLIYDLNVDPGERYGLSANTELYRKILPLILRAKKAEEAKVGVFARSEIQKGTSQQAYICCNKQFGTKCKPFPKCCDCNKMRKEEESHISTQTESENDSIWGSYTSKSDNDIEEVPKVEILIN